MIRALEDAGVGVELVEQPVPAPGPARPGPRAPPRRDPGDGRRVGLRPRRPRRAGPPRRGRPGQPQARQGRRHHPGPRAGPGRAAARPRRLGRLHARVAVGVRAAASLAAEVGCDVAARPRRGVVAGARARRTPDGWLRRRSGRARQDAGPPHEDARTPTEIARVRGTARAPTSSSTERVTSLAAGEEVFVVERQGEWTRVLAPDQPTHLDPAGYPGWVRSEALRARTTRSRWRAASSARRTSGAGWAATASTARGWCTSRFRAVGSGCPATRPTRRPPPCRSRTRAGRPLLLRAARRGGQPRRVRDRGRPAAREPGRRRGRGADARGAPGNAARCRAAASMTLASGVGSHPGDDQRAYDEAVRLVLGELPDLAYLPEVPGRGATATMTGRGAGRDGRARRRPAAGRLAAHRRPRHRPPPGPQPARAGPRRARGAGAGLRGHVQGAGGRTVDAGSDRRAAARRQGARPTSVPGATWRRRWPRGSDHVADVRRRVPGADRLVVQVDEPALAAVLAGAVPTASGFGRHRTVAPARGLRGAGLGARRDRRRGRRAVGALLRRRHAARPAARRRRRAGCPSTTRSCPPATTTTLAEALEAGETVALGRRAVHRPGDGRRPTARSPSRCSAGRHARPRPRRGSATGWCSRRPAASPAPRRPGPKRSLGLLREAAAPAQRRFVCGPPCARRETADESVLVQTPACTTSGPSVASSSCLTLRKTQMTTEAPSIMHRADQERVGRALGEDLLCGDLLDASICSGVTCAPAAAGGSAELGTRSVMIWVATRAEDGQAQRAADLLHGVQHARADAGVLGRAGGGRRSA